MIAIDVNPPELEVLAPDAGLEISLEYVA